MGGRKERRVSSTSPPSHPLCAEADLDPSFNRAGKIMKK